MQAKIDKMAMSVRTPGLLLNVHNNSYQTAWLSKARSQLLDWFTFFDKFRFNRRQSLASLGAHSELGHMFMCEITPKLSREVLLFLNDFESHLMLLGCVIIYIHYINTLFAMLVDSFFFSGHIHSDFQANNPRYWVASKLVASHCRESAGLSWRYFQSFLIVLLIPSTWHDVCNDWPTRQTAH